MARGRGKKKAPNVRVVIEGAWMATFSDLLTLLLAFFVLLLSMSSMDDKMFKDAFGFFQGAFGTLSRQKEPGLRPDFIVPIPAPIPETLVDDAEQIMNRHMREKTQRRTKEPQVEPEPPEYKHLFVVEAVPEGLDVRIAGSVLFDDDDRLSGWSRQLLREVATEVAEGGVPVRVESYLPPTGRRTERSWDRSVRRASLVTDVMATTPGVERHHLSMMGYGRAAPRSLRVGQGGPVIRLTFFTNLREPRRGAASDTNAPEAPKPHGR